tara:strand:+ start:1193 stop:2206 length:1014 start_codon:yes stop_codon:yes gene_type:complete
MNMTDPDPRFTTFLAQLGYGSAPLEPLPGDASARRYLRLRGAGLLLMEDRHNPAGFAGFITLAQHLRALGLSAPKVLAADPNAGLALIEDFGVDTYGALLARGADETALYSLAIDALLHLHHAPNAIKTDVPRFDTATLLQELQIFSDWFVPALRPDLDVAEFDAGWRALWHRALAPLEDQQNALVLRDFHIDNLMLLPDRSGVARCGLLDFQEGVKGAAEYDLVSLLQDARRDLAPGLEAQMLDRYLASSPAHQGARAEILHRYQLLGAQRHTRIAGLFLRLNQRDNKPRYLRFLPRVLDQMQSALTAAGLHDIAANLDATLPGWRTAGPKLAIPR